MYLNGKKVVEVKSTYTMDDVLKPILDKIKEEKELKSVKSKKIKHNDELYYQDYFDKNKSDILILIDYNQWLNKGIKDLYSITTSTKYNISLIFLKKVGIVMTLTALRALINTSRDIVLRSQIYSNNYLNQKLESTKKIIDENINPFDNTDYYEDYYSIRFKSDNKSIYNSNSNIQTYETDHCIHEVSLVMDPVVSNYLTTIIKHKKVSQADIDRVKSIGNFQEF